VELHKQEAIEMQLAQTLAGRQHDAVRDIHHLEDELRWEKRRIKGLMEQVKKEEGKASSLEGGNQAWAHNRQRQQGKVRNAQKATAEQVSHISSQLEGQKEVTTKLEKQIQHNAEVTKNVLFELNQAKQQESSIHGMLSDQASVTSELKSAWAQGRGQTQKVKEYADRTGLVVANLNRDLTAQAMTAQLLRKQTRQQAAASLKVEQQLQRWRAVVGELRQRLARAQEHSKELQGELGAQATLRSQLQVAQEKLRSMEAIDARTRAAVEAEEESNRRMTQELDQVESAAAKQRNTSAAKIGVLQDEIALRKEAASIGRRR